MTFLNAFNCIKNIHKDNDLVIYEIIFYLSKTVKSKIEFIENRNNEIDFDINELKNLSNEYFINKKPLDHIVKHTNFLGIKLKINDGILSPRTETELLCNLLVDKIKKIFSNKPIDIVDLCCGSGNIGLFLKKKFTSSNVTCVDINPKAIANTIENAKSNSLVIKTIEEDYLQAIVNNKLKFNVIAMNPPYVSSNELDLNMTKYESRISFTNSSNSCEFYFKILDNYKVITKDKFLLGFEIGHDQKTRLEEKLKITNLNYKFFKDLSNHDRVLLISNCQL